MKKNEIIEEAKEKLSRLANIDKINSGGCLYAAYGTYLNLHKNKVPLRNISIVQLRTPSSLIGANFKRNEKYLNSPVEKQNSLKANSGIHFALKVYDRIFDSTGDITDKIDYEYHKEFLEMKGVRLINRFCKSSLTYGDWNVRFNRALTLPKIEKILDVELKEKYNV